MQNIVSATEKRFFFLYLFIICISAISVSFGQSGLALSAVILGFFGFFRLTYLLEEQIKNMPSFLSLPSKILFGLSEKEESYKNNIFKVLQQRDVMGFFIISFFYMAWVIFCGVHMISQEKVSNIFQKDIPTIPALSYLNLYETMQGIIGFSMIGMVVLLSMTFSQSKIFLKIMVVFLMPIFLILLIYNFWQSDFIFSLPPLYTALMQGIGAGKAEILFTHQGDIFLYPPTELFMRYIEVGLIGLILFFALCVIPAFYFLKNIISPGVADFYLLSGFGVLLCLFAVDCFLIGPELTHSLQIIGFSIVGMAWGIKITPQNPQNSLTKL